MTSDFTVNVVSDAFSGKVSLYRNPCYCFLISLSDCTDHDAKASYDICCAIRRICARLARIIFEDEDLLRVRKSRLRIMSSSFSLLKHLREYCSDIILKHKISHWRYV